MNDMDLRKDWLTGNAVLAFVGALIMAQGWGTSEGAMKLLFIIPGPDFIVIMIIAVLVVCSLFLALATIVESLQRWALFTAVYSSPGLSIIGLAAFLLSWSSVISKLSLDIWWSWCLVVVGIVFLLFLVCRIACGIIEVIKSIGAEANAGDNLIYGQRDIGGWSVPTLKLSRADRTLEVRVQGEIINATNKSERLDPWRRKVMSAVQAARGGKPWNSDSECAVSVGLRFHPDSHRGDSFDVDNFTKPIFDAVAGGLFSDDAPEAVGYWHFPDSNFKTLLIHRLPNADDASEEGTAIFVSSRIARPSRPRWWIKLSGLLSMSAKRMRTRFRA